VCAPASTLSLVGNTNKSFGSVADRSKCSLPLDGTTSHRTQANLQGIWADGLNAPWNGDYHININLQMSYWGVYSANLAEMGAPMAPFLHDLAVDGARVARKWYNATGWVAHGFTDISGRATAMSAPEWSLCVVCGAWTALALVDEYEYTCNRTMLHSALIPLLEGSVRFFLDYLTPYTPAAGGGSVLVTGPTTSPENSYVWEDPSGGGKSYRFLTLAPHIDVAVLVELFQGYERGCADADAPNAPVHPAATTCDEDIRRAARARCSDSVCMCA
jgi:alpha-L-fucosidase 2